MNTPSTVASETSAPGVWAAWLPRVLYRAAFFSLLLYCVGGSLLILVGTPRAISLHGETTGSEFVNPLAGILKVRTGHLYPPISAPPYDPQPFGPLFYMAGALVARAAHLDVDATIRLGRTLDFICLVLSAFVAWLISRRLNFSNGASALAAMMLLAQPLFFSWGATMRPDVPALLLTLCALYFVLLVRNMGLAACAVAGLLVGLGFLMKQSAASAGIAIAIVYLLRREFARLVVVTAAAAAPVLVVFAYLFSRHEPFLDHYLAAGRETWSLMGGVGWVALHLSKPTVFVALSVAAVGFLRAVTEGEEQQMIASFAAVSLLSGFATIPQLGGQTNYFIPGLAGCALLLPFAMRAFVENLDSIKITGVLAACGFLAAFGECAFLYRGVAPMNAGRQIPPGYFSGLKIFSDDGYLAVHGRDPELLDPFTVHSLQLQNHWNPEPVVREIEAGDYDLAIFTDGNTVLDYRGIAYWGPEIVGALNANYEVLCTAGYNLVLKPRSRNVEATPEMLSRVLGPCSVKPPDAGPNLSFGRFAR